MQTKNYVTGKPPFKFLVLYALAFFGAWCALLAPTTISLAYKVGDLFGDDKKTTYLSIILAVGAVCALISNPIFGKLSDGCYSKMGRRKPFLISGLVGGTIFLCTLTFCNQLWSLILVWCLTQIAFNLAIAALNAIMVDKSSPKYRGTISAASGLGGTVGMLSGAGIATLFTTMVDYQTIGQYLLFIAPGIFGAILIAIFIIFLKDTPIQKPQGKMRFWKNLITSFTFNPIKNSDFTKILICRFLLFMGISCVTAYLLFYLQDKIYPNPPDHDTKPQEVLLIVNIIAAACAVVGSVVSGKLTDMFGGRKLFIIISAAFFIGALLLIAFVTQQWVMYVVAVVLGFVNGIVNTVSQVVVTLVMPNQQEAGKWMGISNISSTLPQSIGPAIAPLFLMIGGPNNYTALFIAVIVILIGGGGLTFFIKKVK